MKRISLIVFTAMLFNVTDILSQDIRARTLGGETVMLKKNGTWFILNSTGLNEDTAITFEGKVVLLQKNGTWKLTNLTRLVSTIPLPSFPQHPATKINTEETASSTSTSDNLKRGDNFVGRQVPSFTFRNLDGSDVDINSMRGKVVLINFWAGWCKPCRVEIPHLEMEVWRRFKPYNFAMIALTTDHTDDDLKKFMSQSGLTFPMSFDRNKSAHRAFNVNSIPRNYVVGKDGKIIYQSAGYSNEQFKEMVDVITKALMN